MLQSTNGGKLYMSIRRLHVKTTERDYYYESRDFEESNINMHFGADGRGIGLIKIIDSKWIEYESHKRGKIEVGNQNWSIYIRIFETAIEEGFMRNDTTCKTRIVGEVKCYSKEGEIMSEDNFDWIAWHYSFECNKEVKEIATN